MNTGVPVIPPPGHHYNRRHFHCSNSLSELLKFCCVKLMVIRIYCCYYLLTFLINDVGRLRTPRHSVLVIFLVIVIAQCRNSKTWSCPNKIAETQWPTDLTYRSNNLLVSLFMSHFTQVLKSPHNFHIIAPSIQRCELSNCPFITARIYKMILR